MFISLLSYFLRPFNWLSWLLLHWAMLPIRSKLLPSSYSIISRKASFPRFSSSFSFFHISSFNQAIPVLSEPLELVSSQFFSAWVKDMQQQGQKKKQDILCCWIHGCDSTWLCGLMPFKILNYCSCDTHVAWIQLGIVTILCCKLMLQVILCRRK